MIRRRILLATLICASSGPLAAQTRAADSLAVLQVLEQHREAGSRFDAERQISLYTPDAVWINAFGTRRAGRDSILTYFRALYADTGYRESRLISEVPHEVILLREGVAIVHEFVQRDGQRMADGTVISRRIHVTYVLSRENGRWLIRYQHIADERPRRNQEGTSNQYGFH